MKFIAAESEIGEAQDRGASREETTLRRADSTPGVRRGQFNACSDRTSSALCELRLCFIDLPVQTRIIAEALIEKCVRTNKRDVQVVLVSLLAFLRHSLPLLIDAYLWWPFKGNKRRI